MALGTLIKHVQMHAHTLSERVSMTDQREHLINEAEAFVI
jgi:hypothetical protein